MNENAKKFLEEAGKDAALAEKLAGIGSVEELLALAAEKGYALTAEDLASVLVGQKAGELDDGDLDDVTGGVGVPQLYNGLIARSTLGTLSGLLSTRVTTLENRGSTGGSFRTLENRSGAPTVASTLENRTGTGKSSSGLVNL